MRPLALLLLAIGLPLLPTIEVQVLRSVGALPAYLTGRFDELAACEQVKDGSYLVFDRRQHAVFRVPASRDSVQEVIRIGAEKGRILRPTAFDLAHDGTFVVADAPESRGRVQVFFETGASLGGFTLPGHQEPLIVLDGLVVSGIGSLQYTGQSVLISQPASGALVTEYALDGRTIRTFGQLRRTGQEQDREVHLALNAGLIVLNPKGGFYYVFLAGTPMFRKYTAAGTLAYERHIEGIELDEYLRDMPTAWPRRRSQEGVELPLVYPAVRAAAADSDGNLWISLNVQYTYVYDAGGDKQRVVQFKGAGLIAPTSLAFTNKGQILVTPGCYVFEPR